MTRRPTRARFECGCIIGITVGVCDNIERPSGWQAECSVAHQLFIELIQARRDETKAAAVRRKLHAHVGYTKQFTA